MKFTNRSQPGVPFTHPSFEDDEVWHFHRQKTVEDGAEIRSIIREMGDDPYAGARATLLRQTARWTLRVPEDFVTETGEPHPDAGKVAPVTIEFVRSLPEDVVLDALAFVSTLYATRSAAEAAEFPEAG